ncbi:MAG TPA: phosphoribosylformylglycinamidine synthase subunit PurS [Firmicutes bacterium]|nr:phosphoribosylformylglycinamidine synthase subunit PurS [Candidatus Fermentithermobacillaceae bacterium]
MKFKGTVTVWLKESIFDPQGAAVKGSLAAMGFKEVENVRIGKNIVITLEAESPEAAKDLLDSMARKLLANPVTESYRVYVEEEKAGAQR